MKLAILASGEGTTGEVLFDLATVVVTNIPGAGIIERAKKAGLPVEIIERNGKSLEEFGEELLSVLKKYEIEFISQNGWEALTPASVVNEYRGKIVNNHPAPLDPGYPDFGGKGMKGLAVHQAVINFKNRVQRLFDSEIDLHLVTEEFDKGELVALKKVEVKKEDTAEDLQNRLKEVEKQLLKEFWEEVNKTGEIKTIKREERVMKPEEVQLLEEAKEEAIKEYS